MALIGWGCAFVDTVGDSIELSSIGPAVSHNSLRISTPAALTCYRSWYKPPSRSCTTSSSPSCNHLANLEQYSKEIGLYSCDLFPWLEACGILLPTWSLLFPPRGSPDSKGELNGCASPDLKIFSSDVSGWTHLD